jgi:hypothetical protein
MFFKIQSVFTILFSILIPFFLLVDTFPGFAKKSLEKLQAAAYHFSKEVCENSGIVSTNRKTGFNFQSPTALGKFESFQFLAAENL